MATDGHIPMIPSRNQREHWEVVQIIFFAGSYTNVHDNYEEHAHWRMSSLGGIDQAWSPGTWLKGPISPFDVTPNV